MTRYAGAVVAAFGVGAIAWVGGSAIVADVHARAVIREAEATLGRADAVIADVERMVLPYGAPMPTPHFACQRVARDDNTWVVVTCCEYVRWQAASVDPPTGGSGPPARALVALRQPVTCTR